MITLAHALPSGKVPPRAMRVLLDNPAIPIADMQRLFGVSQTAVYRWRKAMRDAGLFGGDRSEVYYGFTEAAEWLGCSRPALASYIKQGLPVTTFHDGSQLIPFKAMRTWANTVLPTLPSCGRPRKKAKVQQEAGTQ